MKKFSLMMLLGLVLVPTLAFSDANINDSAQLLNRQTRELIKQKNNRYFQTKEQPQIEVQTFKRVKHLTPKKLNQHRRRVYLVIGVTAAKREVQIYSSKDLHSSFTATIRGNIIRAAVTDLQSKHSAKLNRGIRFVFRAIATKIDQRYQYALDKYDLSSDELAKVNHAHTLALPMALAIVILISALAYLFKQTRRRHDDEQTK